MTEEAIIGRFGLPPRADDVPEIRRTLAAACELAHDADTLAMKALCVLLFAFGAVEDSLAIWRAKRSSFDAGCSIDVQLLCGAGYAITLGYLRTLTTDEAREALAYLEKCDAAGDFEGHDEPGSRLSEVVPAYRAYLGI